MPGIETVSEQARQNQADDAKRLLQIISELVQSLHSQQPRHIPVHLDATLDKELGLDSLSRVELIARLERGFEVSLSERAFSEAETPRDLLRFLHAAQGHSSEETRSEILPQVLDDVPLPYQARTIVEVLRWHVEHHPDRSHLNFLPADEAEQGLTYAQLWQGAEQVAAGLQARDIEPGQSVAIMLPSGIDYFFSFMGIMLAGAVPVPIYPPVRPSQLEEHMRRHRGILGNCSARMLITVAEAKVFARLLRSQVESLRHIVTLKDLTARGNDYRAPQISEHDIAFLQYTSGSTGDPKGVVLSHRNLLSNIRAMGVAVNAGPRDVFVSWLPLYHDMGLIGAWLGSMYFAMRFVVMSPLSFLSRPQRWLWAIHRYRGTLSASPNFGYELCLKRIRDEDMDGLDLSCWRMAFNGAEPVSPATIERFTQRFSRVGFHDKTMMPVYGLAESSVGLAFPQRQHGPLIDTIERDTFMHSGQAVPVSQAQDNALRFVASGEPIPGHEIRIVDDSDRELPERQEGHLQFRGPSSTSGYYHNPEKTRQLFKQDWLDSGDLAYISGGEVFITGRTKDIIIRGGRNIYPHELEEAVGNLAGIRKGCVAVFASSDSQTGSEKLVVLAETREQEMGRLEQLQREINRLATDLNSLPADDIVLAPPHTVLKTSSGKIRRAACRQLYEAGKLQAKHRAVWFQLLRLSFTSLRLMLRHLLHSISATLYAVYAWGLYIVLAPVAFLAAVLIPPMRWRWWALHGLARTLAWLSATPFQVQGREHLQQVGRASILVANHSSYLDGYLLVAAISKPFSYVAKAELARNPLLRLFILRMRAELVERFDSEQVLSDTRRIVSGARRQRSYMFFPEGTFSRKPGLQAFHMGAFTTAIESGLPVVPIAIHGARSILRAGSWFPRRGRITVVIGPPLQVADFLASSEDKWAAALQLRQAARNHILNYCGEPDGEG